MFQWSYSRQPRGRPGFDSLPMHLRSSIINVCCANYFMKFDVSFTWRRSLKGRGHPGLNWRSFDLQLKTLPLSYISVQVTPRLLQNSTHKNFPIFFFSVFFCVSGCSPKSLEHLLSHWWFSGRILACDTGHRGSIPHKYIYNLAYSKSVVQIFSWNLTSLSLDTNP